MIKYQTTRGHIPDPRTLTSALDGHWHGNYGRALCPACGGNKQNPPLSIKYGNKRLLLHCFRGCEYRDILNALGSYGLTDSNPLMSGGTEQQRKCDAELADKKSRQAQACWAETSPIAGTPAEAYLRCRGIARDLPDTLRFHPECWHGPTTRHLPAMVARIIGGERFAIHRTYLTTDGRKADIQPNKMMLGGAKGGSVRLREAFGPLLIGEGIESVLSAMLFVSDLGSAWAALSTSGLTLVTLPKQPGELIVAVDGDDAGRAAGRSLAQRATAAGWRVSIADPGDGLDFNDLAGSA